MCGPSYAGISIYMYQCFLIGIIFLVLHIGYDKLHHDLSIVQVSCMRLPLIPQHYYKIFFLST